MTLAKEYVPQSDMDYYNNLTTVRDQTEDDVEVTDDDDNIHEDM